VLSAITPSGSTEAWIIDDTGFPKKERHSVGVTRQYSGQLGGQDNCQVAVTLSLANHDASLPVAYGPYLPEDWAKDRDRRHKAKVPEIIAFQTKPQIALEQQKLKRELGLGDYEGRGWRGFHHHATLDIAAYGFLIAERGNPSPLRTSVLRAALAICHSPGLSTQRR
jgi:SRSO17 transposase